MTARDLSALLGLERALTPDEWRALHGTRTGAERTGHIAPPGTGPEGETCGSCKHLVRKSLAKVYRKCGLNEANWTGGPGTDIRCKDAACKFWERGMTARGAGRR